MQKIHIFDHFIGTIEVSEDNSMYKLIACDLDETLLKKDKSVSEENIKAIHAFEEAGGIFRMCYW